MSQFRTRNKKVIELFDEKIGDVIRTFCFSHPDEFYEFVKGFKEMKYPDIVGDIKIKGERKKKIILSIIL